VELTLPLLVTRVLADHEDTPMTADDLALLADPLHRGSDLHVLASLDDLFRSMCSPSRRRIVVVSRDADTLVRNKRPREWPYPSPAGGRARRYYL
jgi:hypothetical protein